MTSLILRLLDLFTDSYRHIWSSISLCWLLKNNYIPNLWWLKFCFLDCWAWFSLYKTLWEQLWYLFYSESNNSLICNHGVLFLSFFFLLIYLSPILLGILYALSFRQNSLSKLILLILSATLVFHMGINSLSKERTLSSSTHKSSNSNRNSSSHRVRVLLSSKREKKE